jgi:hypothetical protein
VGLLGATTHAGTIQFAGDTAVGCAYIAEFGRLRDGSSYLGCAVDHDRYRRTPDGWKFTKRVYAVSYLDTTPLAGSAPHAARAFAAGDARRVGAVERAGREGRPPLAVGPVVAVADAGRITEVDFGSTATSSHASAPTTRRRTHEPVRAVAGAALRFGPAPVRGYAEALVTDRSSIRRRP